MAQPAARDGLDEVRRVVGDLAPAELASNPLPDALEQSCRRLAADSGVDVRVQVDGNRSSPSRRSGPTWY